MEPEEVGQPSVKAVMLCDFFCWREGRGGPDKKSLRLEPRVKKVSIRPMGSFSAKVVYQPSPSPGLH